MAIEKYGTSFTYGYGVYCFWKETEKGIISPIAGFPREGFRTDVLVVAKSKITTESQATVSGFPTKVTPHFYRSSIPVYAVFDSGTKTWREYFSGLTLNVCSGHSFDYKLEFDVDAKKLPFCRSLTVYGLNECSATEFEDAVSVYSNRQIHRMVDHLYEINKQAKKWSDTLDQAVQAVTDERTRKESEVSSINRKLASGFGAYRNAVEDPVTNTTQLESAPKTLPTEKEMLLWIRQGRCAYCGGEFKGLFSKSCRVCGKNKDYR